MVRITTQALLLVAATIGVCWASLPSHARNPTATVQPVPGQVPQFGNGFVAAFANASLEFVAGVFDGASTHSTRAGLPNQLRVFALCPDGSWPGYTSPHGAAYPFVLDTRRGLVNLTGTCTGGITVAQTWLAHRTRPEVTVLLINARDASGNATSKALTLRLATFETDDAALAHVKRVPVTQYGGVVTSAFETLVPERSVSPSSPDGTIRVSYAVTPIPKTLTVPANGATPTLLVAARCASSSSPPPTENAPKNFTDGCAMAAVEYATATWPDELLREHVAAWGRLNDAAMSVTMQSSAPAAAAVLPDVLAASQYALWCSLADTVPFSTSPGGLATDGYNGHTFWDMETWMQPTLSLFTPSLARRSPIEYRLRRLAGAADNAVNIVGGKTGIAFPWESALTGFDVCPWPRGEHSELHVTADVMLSWRLHYRATGSVAFLRDLWEPLLNASRFWKSRATYDATTATWSINSVTPPDEYAFGNNSAYTNTAVSAAVNFTVDEAAPALGIPWDRELTELAMFAAGLVIPYNATAEYHPELQQGYSGGKVKQADVVLMQYPVGAYMPRNAAQNDLAYYANRTDPRGPAMTWSVFGINYGALGDRQEEAVAYTLKGFNDNALPPYWQWYEVTGGAGCPNFLTGAGGFLQSVWAGLGGVRVHRNELEVLGYNASYLDAFGVETLHLPLTYRGVRFDLDYSNKPAGVAITPHVARTCNTTIIVNGVKVPPGTPYKTLFSYGDVAVTVTNPCEDI